MLQQYQIAGDTARELELSVEDAIRAGGLRPGEALPTVRGLASRLGVSPATVAAAYRELRRRGLVAGVGRAGTRVRAAPPIASRPPLAVPRGVRDLRTGGPDPALLPTLPPLPTFGRLYGEPAVSPRLARVARERLAADGIDTTHLAVVGGALDGVERVLGAHLRAGDAVAVEDPGYGAVLDLVVALGLEVTPLRVDDRGVVPGSLARALEGGARAAVLTPRAQNPTGAAWDPPRADELAAVLRGHPGALVIEDDHAGPAAGAPVLTVCRGASTWATVRSVSKWLGPDLRVAVLAGDATTVSRVEGRQALGAGWVSHLLQDAVAHLWDAPETGVLLERAAATYARRRRALTAALAVHGLTATGSSGLSAWVAVRDEHSVVEGLVERGWAVTPGERFRVASPPGIRIAFATLAEDEAPAFARALADCVRRPPVRIG
ncbi:MAG TPA: aminotransferase class I/II-fold pyridoxal phosphate-dependent enzyme [Candidatus Dormibacteraeota bacterium]